MTKKELIKMRDEFLKDYRESPDNYQDYCEDPANDFDGLETVFNCAIEMLWPQFLGLSEALDIISKGGREFKSHYCSKYHAKQALDKYGVSDD